MLYREQRRAGASRDGLPAGPDGIIQILGVSA